MIRGSTALLCAVSLLASCETPAAKGEAPDEPSTPQAPAFDPAAAHAEAWVAARAPAAELAKRLGPAAPPVLLDAQLEGSLEAYAKAAQGIEASSLSDQAQTELRAIQFLVNRELARQRGHAMFRSDPHFVVRELRRWLWAFEVAHLRNELPDAAALAAVRRVPRVVDHLHVATRDGLQSAAEQVTALCDSLRWRWLDPQRRDAITQACTEAKTKLDALAEDAASGAASTRAAWDAASVGRRLEALSIVEAPVPEVHRSRMLTLSFASTTSEPQLALMSVSALERLRPLPAKRGDPQTASASEPEARPGPDCAAVLEALAEHPTLAKVEREIPKPDCAQLQSRLDAAHAAGDVAEAWLVDALVVAPAIEEARRSAGDIAGSVWTPSQATRHWMTLVALHELGRGPAELALRDQLATRLCAGLSLIEHPDKGTRAAALCDEAATQRANQDPIGALHDLELGLFPTEDRRKAWALAWPHAPLGWLEEALVAPALAPHGAAAVDIARPFPDATPPAPR